MQSKISITVPKPLLHTAVDDLQPLDQEVYTSTLDALVDALRPLPGIVLVCPYGSLGFPGISDLDVWIVTRDDQFFELEQRIQNIAKCLPHGKYLFAHQIFVVPESLLSDIRLLFIDQIVECSHVLFGDAKLLKRIQPINKFDRAVSMAMWSSTLWKVLWGMPHQKQQSVRNILLTLQAFVIQTARFHQFLDNKTESERVLQWGKNIRPQIWNEQGPARITHINKSLNVAIEQWIAAQWAFQKWWETAGQWEQKVVHKDIPPFTADLVAQLSNVFSPHLDEVIMQRYTQEQSHLGSACRRYTCAVERAKQWTREQGREEYTLFLQSGNGIFPSPFNYVATQEQYNIHGKAYTKERDASLQAHASPAREGLYSSIGSDIAGKMLLDIGCGTGEDLAYLQSKGAHVFGIDSAETMIALAKQRHPELHNLFVGSMHKMPFPNSTFDIICSKYAMHYSKKLDDTFREIARVLKPGGIFVCVEAHPLLGFVRKDERTYHKQMDFPIPITEPSLQAPTHTFAEYISDEVLQHFELCHLQEGEDALAGTDEKIPYFLLLTLRKK